MNKNHSQYKHGMKNTRFYRIWVNMKTRCGNKNHSWYSRYGGRGIRVCSHWQVFYNFMSDMHESYEQHVSMFGEQNTTIDRIDPNGNYDLHNCRWATRSEQSRNAQKHVMITFRGVTKPLFKWAEDIGISYGTLYHRIHFTKLPLSKAMQKESHIGVKYKA